MHKITDAFTRSYAQVSLPILRRNLHVLARGWKGVVPMIKCNAYGHGLVEVAQGLRGEKSVEAFGVATLSEAFALRDAGVKNDIWFFSDASPWTEDAHDAVVRARLTPVLHSMVDLQELLELSRRKRSKHLSFHLKFNTGMNRLGIAFEDARAARALIERAGMKAQGVCSHFATSESPRSTATRRQLERFRELVAIFRGHGASHIHCSNSAAILNESQLELADLCSVARPGIGLYGYAGTIGRRRGLKPALTWFARVLDARTLARGERVGYGGTFTAKRPTPQAVIGVGYGDGFKRVLSNQTILVGGKGKPRATRVLGRVSMDLTSIQMRLNVGDWVTLLGEGEEQGARLAKAAGTIEYEILTSIAPRVPRVYQW